jgi:hypothetical protein
MLTIMFILVLSSLLLGFGVFVTVLIYMIGGEGSMCLNPTHFFHTLRTKEGCIHHDMNGDTHGIAHGTRSYPFQMDVKSIDPPGLPHEAHARR